MCGSTRTKHERLALTSVIVSFIVLYSQENNYGLACYNITKDEWISLIDSLDSCDFRGGVVPENILHTESGSGLIAYDVAARKNMGYWGRVTCSVALLFSVDSSIYVGRGNGILQCSLSSGA